MHLSTMWLLVAALLSSNTAYAQTTTESPNALNNFLSGAFSVYTEVVSILNSDVKNTATSSSSTTFTTSATITTTTPSTTSSSTQSLSAITSSSTTASNTAAAASATSTATAAASQGTNHRTTAIIVGSILGALVLGLLILTALLVCRRRRLRSARRPLSPLSDEVESWRMNCPSGPHTSGGTTGIVSHESRLAGLHANHRSASTVPDMAEHAAYRSSHENPFVPIPPPARRTAPNSRTGLTDGIVPGQEPFRRDGLGRPLGTRRSRSSSDQSTQKSNRIVPAAGASALGAGTMPYHDEKEIDTSFETQPFKGRNSISRNPVGAPNISHTRAVCHSNSWDSNAVTIGHHSKAPIVYTPYSAESGYSPTSRVVDSRVDDPPLTRASDDSSQPLLTRTTSGGPPMAELAGDGVLSATALAIRQNGKSTQYTDERHRGDVDSGVGCTNAMGCSQVYRPVSYPNTRQNQTCSQTARISAHAHRRESIPPAVHSRPPKRARFSDTPFERPGIEQPPSYHSSRTDSSNSSWRLSTATPGRRRTSADSPRTVRNSGGRETAVRTVGRANNGGTWERLRLSDFRADEAQRLKQSTGYGHYDLTGADGVGQAM